MVFDRSTAMGCAITRFQERREGKTWHTTYLACNYSGSQYLNQPIYKVGPPARGCRKGPHPNYKNLCAVNEQVDLYPFNDDYPNSNAPTATNPVQTTARPPPTQPQGRPSKKSKSSKSKPSKASKPKQKKKRTSHKLKTKKVSLWQLLLGCLCGARVK